MQEHEGRIGSIDAPCKEQQSAARGRHAASPSRSRSPACSPGHVSPLPRSRSASPGGGGTSVQVAAASRSVLHAAACSPPVFNSEAGGRQQAPFTPQPYESTLSGMAADTRAGSTPVLSAIGSELSQLSWTSPVRVPGAHGMDNSSAAPGHTLVSGCKLYASANMAPLIHVNSNGRLVERGQLPHGSSQPCASVYSPELGISPKRGVRPANHGGPLAALAPPDHALHSSNGVGPPGRPWRADARHINFSPLNLERFALARFRQEKQVAVQNQEVISHALARRSGRK